MEFSNLTFLYLFLPLAMLVYFLAPRGRIRNWTLLGASILFYAMGQPIWLLLIVLLTYANFRMSQLVEPENKKSLILPLAINIGVLCLFKYLDFLLGIFGITSAEGGFLLGLCKGVVRWLNGMGATLAEPTSALPLGLSFYTFQVISYMVDVYCKKYPAEDSFQNFLLYLTMFPKMVQGPITGYDSVSAQLRKRNPGPRMIFGGINRFAMGLAKKVLLADYCGKMISELAGAKADGSFVGAWLSAFLFFFQLYFDFSGYSDMAIGLGRIFGFKLPENFDLPYTSRSITEFWRRWHISLGSFFRDYVYIPLGGNRKGKLRQILNLLVVWLLTGLWHGAGWNFVLWGLYFFVLLAAEKQLMPQLEKIPSILRNLMTMFFVMLGWVLFSHTSMGSMGSALGGMFGLGGFTTAGIWTRLLNSVPLLLVCGIGASGLPRMVGRIWCGLLGMHTREARKNDQITWNKVVYAVSQFLFTLLLLWLCTVSLVGSTSAPSIYASF